MIKLVVAECKQEVSSFNPVASRYEDFAISRGGELFSYHRGVRDEVGGALSVLETRRDLHLVPTFGARAITSGGTLAAMDFRRISREFLDSLLVGGRPDAAYFALHGAMGAEGEDDPEGYLLQEARQVLGEKIPIVVSLDLHGILTDRMLAHSDAIVVYHTYPHVDFFETGARAARVLIEILDGKARPVTARVKIPALVRGDELITATGSIGHSIRLAERIERMPRGLSAGMFIGNPFTDVRELRSSSLVVMNDDEAAARELAVEMSGLFWQHHAKMRVPLTNLTESVRLACDTHARNPSGTVAMVDAADATSSGASGDSNAILRELVAADYRGSALIPIVDAPVVERALAAGIGSRLRAAVGGSLDTRFRPLEIEADVRMLSDGHFRSESFGHHWSAGKTAVLRSGPFTLVVTSRPVSLYDRALFHAHGQDPRRFNLVVVKSPHCERHMFADWCDRLINVDAPGATSANLQSLGHVHCPRPIFPLDEGVEFMPRPDVWRRS